MQKCWKIARQRREYCNRFDIVIGVQEETFTRQQKKMHKMSSVGVCTDREINSSLSCTRMTLSPIPSTAWCLIIPHCYFITCTLKLFIRFFSLFHSLCTCRDARCKKCWIKFSCNFFCPSTLLRFKKVHHISLTYGEWTMTTKFNGIFDIATRVHLSYEK